MSKFFITSIYFSIIFSKTLPVVAKSPYFIISWFLNVIIVFRDIQSGIPDIISKNTQPNDHTSITYDF